MIEGRAYGTSQVAKLLGVSAAVVRSLTRASRVRPQSVGGRLRYSFQDLIVLRTAHTLFRAKLPPRRVTRCLRQLREKLPAALPLSGLSIVAIGDEIAVREGGEHWDPGSGQYLLALEVTARQGEICRLGAPRGGRRRPEAGAHRGVRVGTEAESNAEPAGASARASASSSPLREVEPEADAVADYERGFDLEDTDTAEAIHAYERCLRLDAGHVAARLNYGRLLHLSGRLEEAERLYRAGDPGDALLRFNLAVVLEDLQREREAMQAYREALEIDPYLADALFNLARLHQRAGDDRESFRYLLAYRRARESGGS